MSAYPEPSPLGSCALCGAEVYSDERFPRLSAHQYICEDCDDMRCVMCGVPEALLEEGEDEPVCATCRKSEEQIEARRQGEFYTQVDWIEIFRGVKES